MKKFFDEIWKFLFGEKYAEASKELRVEKTVYPNDPVDVHYSENYPESAVLQLEGSSKKVKQNLNPKFNKGVVRGADGRFQSKKETS